jgi:hypothetical protein
VAQFEFVSEGHGFSRAVSAAKSILAFSRWGNVFFKLHHYLAVAALWLSE